MRPRYETLLRSLPTLALTAALVIGVPAVLIILVGWPLPTTWPSVEAIQLALRSGIDPALIVNTLAIIAWIAWAQLMFAIVVEARAAWDGRTARRIPIVPGVQPFAARLVTTIALVASSFGPLRPVPVPAATLDAVTAPTTHSVVIDNPGAPVTESLIDEPIPDPADHPAYETMHLDTWWSIAEDTLGEGKRWHEIRDLNVGSPDAGGEIITSTSEHVPSGTSLRLPADAVVPSSPAKVKDTSGEVRETATLGATVERGDSFWRIAEETLERAWGREPTSAEVITYWQAFIAANRDRLLPPHDPNLIYPNQVFELPEVPPNPQPSIAHQTSVEERATGDTVSGETEYTVERGDSFWRIAEETLQEEWGRPPTSAEVVTYWQAFIAANSDRLEPPHDPNYVYPWQVLLLPAPPADPVAATDPADQSQPPTVAETEAPTPTGDHRDQLDHPPSTNLPAGDTAASEETDPVATPDEQAVPDAASDDTEALPLDIPGPADRTLETADDSEPQPTLPTPEPAPVIQPADPPSEETAAPTPADATDDAAAFLPSGATLAGLGILAASLIALVNRLRRRQLRQRQPGTAPTPPPPTATRVEQTLRAAAASEAIELVDLALRAMANDINDYELPPPAVVGVYLEPDQLRVLLWAPNHDAPPGWSVDDDGRSWTLPTAADLTQLHFRADTTPAPYPALVTVGHGDNTQLLLDLTFLGSVQITGEPGDVAATCHTMATELAASPFADTLQVVCVGFGHDLANLERIRVVDDLDDVASLIDEHRPDDQQPWSSPGDDMWRFDGRDRPETLIIFDPRSTASPGGEDLLGVARAGEGIAAVVGYETGDRWVFHLEDGSIQVDPIGYTLHRRNLTRSEQAAVADLITAAKDLEGIPEPDYAELAYTELADAESADTEVIDAEIVDTVVVDTVASDVDSEDHLEEEEVPVTRMEGPEESEDADRAPAPEVKVLGTLEVTELAESFAQAKCAELVTYLALHRRGTERDVLMEALWPEQPPSKQRLSTIIRRARSALGTDADDNPYFPVKTRTELYRLSDDVTCDLERFTSLVQAATSNPTQARGHLQGALELVDGSPFSGAGNDYTWAHTEGLITHAIVAVDNAAHRLAELALEQDDPKLAMWAARQGLTATGVCEECYRNLMRCAISENNQTALDATLEELTAVMDADDGPDAATYLEAETLELYEQHRRGRRTHSD